MFFLISSNWMSYMGLQDSMSPMMNFISLFHDHAMIVVIFIVSSVFYIFFMITVSFLTFSRHFTSNESLEFFWTVLPGLVLVFLAAPSLETLYLLEEMSSPSITIKVMGHQWYWSYDYKDFGSTKSFDSYMIPTEELKSGDFRLLEVDKSTKLPLMKESRMLISSSDVIHSWTIPSFGVKVDAVPGRINQISTFPNRVGNVYGQCSEICGAMHSFMPICLEICSEKDFFDFLKS